MDFIVELLDMHGYNAIIVVVDLFDKQAHFIPTHTTCFAMEAANLYQKHTWNLHGLSDACVSDHEP